MSNRKPFLIFLVALVLMVGLRGTTAYAEEGGEGHGAKPPPVSKWWDIPKVKTPEDQSNQPSLLERWLPQVFTPPEPGQPPGNMFVRGWRWFSGLFKKKVPEKLPPGWKRPLNDPVEVEPAPTPTPPVPGGTVHFDPLTGILSVTGVSVTITKPQPARPATHERASMLTRELMVSEIASWPTATGDSLGETMTSQDNDTIRSNMEEIFAGRQSDGTWVATVQLDVRKIPVIRKNCPTIFKGTEPWTRILNRTVL